MEAILTKQSRIAPRTAVAKPLSAAVAIGTGGPFRAEGPIIVTGGAIGSLIGQAVRASASQRKVPPTRAPTARTAATLGSPHAALAIARHRPVFSFQPPSFVTLVCGPHLPPSHHHHHPRN